MNIYDVLFIMSLISLIILTLIKIYNLISVGTVYDLKMGFILFVAYALIAAIGLVVTLLNPSALYAIVLKLNIWGGSLQILFLVVEIFYTIKDTLDKPVEAYQPK